MFDLDWRSIGVLLGCGVYLVLRIRRLRQLREANLPRQAVETTHQNEADQTVPIVPVVQNLSTMTTDPTIREQTYPYFLQEVPELLQVLEQGLLNLREDCTINQVNTLMRATHTLKGAATSVGLETITTIAHSLEDIFKALCRPDVTIDPDIAALLFEGFECLRLPLMVELTGISINDTEVLDRAAAVFAQLQEKLGDFFGQEAYLPSSIELGFDITQSIFEVGVAQRLDQIEVSIETAQPDELISTLRTQSEVFLGLAESLNLSGFGAIAKATIAALDNHPEQAIPIAQQALADFKAGQAAVLEGDRTQAGQPSETLQRWANLATDSPVTDVLTIDALANDFAIAIEPDETAGDRLLESIWGDQPSVTDAISESDLALIISDADTPVNAAEDIYVANQIPVSQASPTSTPTPIPTKEPISPSPSVRISVEHLDRLSHSIGELLTNQNQQSLQTEQLQASVRTLFTRLRQHQTLLNQLQEQQSRRSIAIESRSNPKRKRNTQNGHSKKRSVASSQASHSMQMLGFDALELERYSESDLFLQSLLDNVVQLTESTDAIELFTRQSAQTLEKQRRLLTGTQNALIEARMVPLGEIFDRFPHILQQLGTRHNKPVLLMLHGTEVLVDKAVAEKLYDPLLHLVRNAFDHGIEPIAVRQKRGKPEKGQIEICAHHQGRFLVIEVRDDGSGLDFERIRQQAVERQLISLEQAEQLTQAQLTDLLFEPGFSTAAQVNDLSGRGVGLDVVRNQIQSLHGFIEVSSELQRGTTFILQIPLSLTIAKLLICKATNTTHAMFADAIEQILIPQPDHIREQYGIKVFCWHRQFDEQIDEQLVPLYSLTKSLKYGSAHPPDPSSASKQESGQVIVFRYQGAFIGLEVDQLIGEQELVIRPLGTIIGSPDYVYGTSVLADGRLTLVIDPIALLQRLVNQQENESARSDRMTALPMLPASLQLQLPTQTYAALPAAPELELKANTDQKILIVDDSITVRQGLNLTLQKAGYHVIQAKDGHEAIEILHQQTDIRLIICDIEMPRVNGFELLRHCQRIPDLTTIPVLILTSRSSDKHRLLASQLGAAAYMTKPYLEHKLLTVVAEVLNVQLIAKT